MSMVSAMKGGKSKTIALVLGFLGAVLPLAPVGAGEIAGRVVDQAGNGVALAVVFVQTPPAGAPPPGKQSAVMDQVHKAFVPGVLPVVVGTEVQFPNHDQIHHHVYSFSRTKTFEIPLYKGGAVPSAVFNKVGVVKLGCNIHDWMSGIILVLPTPYYAVTAENGRFVIPDVPPGTYPLVCWHEGSRQKVDETAQQVQVNGGVTEVTFTLPLKKKKRTRIPLHGRRKYP